MGCSSSRNFTIDEYKINLKLKKERENYNNRQEYFEQVYGHILLDIIKELDPSNPNIETIEVMKNKIKSGDNYKSTPLSTSNLISEDEIRECLIDYMGQLYLSEIILIQEYDVYDTCFKTAKEMKIFSSDRTLDFAKLLVDNFSRLYPKTQNGLFINFNYYNIQQHVLNGILTNLKFNLSYSVQALTLVLDNFSTGNQEMCTGLSEVIDCNRNMISFLLHIFDDNDKEINQNMIENLTPIFNSLKRNENIKFLLLQTEKSYELALTQEMETCIISLLQSDSLLGLYISHFKFSDYLIAEFGRCIAGCKNLKFILIESNILDLNILDNLVIHGIGRNRSINIAILAGFDIPESKAKEYKQVQKHNESLKIFEVIKENLFC